MSDSEDRIEKVIWRALSRHVKADHKFEVRRLPDGEDLEVHCCWCGNTVVAGSAGFMRKVISKLKESGAKVLDVARSISEAA